MLTERGAVMTIFEAYNNISKRLSAAGIDDSSFEARAIIRHITGLSNAEITANPMRALTEFQENNITAILRQREIRYPLQYIFGTWDFYKYKFKVGVGVLIPRSDTETVMDVCLEFIKGKEKADVLDLCAGSGCIGITIKGECPRSQVTLVEKYDEAISYAQKNAKHNNIDVKIVKGDVLEGCECENKYDLIVSNPPYITAEDMKALQPEVQFEPKTALEGGEDGLVFYRAIAEKYKNSLKENGMLVFEVGINQSESVKEILRENGFKDISSRKDLNDIERVVFGTV